MTTIELPEHLVRRLRRDATLQHRSIEALVVDLLSDILKQQDESLSVVDVVARIKRTPPQTLNIRQAQSSLFDALQRIPEDATFDPQRWNADWQHVEDELRAMNQSDEEY